MPTDPPPPELAQHLRASTMICQNCQKHAATIRVTEIPAPESPATIEGAASADPASADPAPPIDANESQPIVKHICEACAVQLDVPHSAVSGKSMADIWKLLQISAQQAAQKRQTVRCESCGTTLEELRHKGRLGCADCYDTFEEYLGEHFERMHGAREHVGRIPGRSESQIGVAKAITSLREELEHAIEEEAYERAASIRDQLRTLEADETSEA